MSGSLTPAGFSIEPIETPRGGRRYRVTDAALHSIEVPSVTTILQVVDKPGLPWWGMKVGVEGTLRLLHDGKLAEVGMDVVPENAQGVVELLTKNKLTVNHTLASAGDRGTRVHDAFEAWCRTGLIPVADGEDAGYLGGLGQALTTITPYAVVDHVEVHVASMEHGYAGRTDAIITVVPGCTVMQPGRWIVDLKTSSGIYTSHFRQLAAYEVAAEESGYGGIDGGYVLWVGKDGKWRLKQSWGHFDEDFLPVLKLYASEQDLKARLK